MPSEWVGGLDVPYMSGPGHTDQRFVFLMAVNLLFQCCAYISICNGYQSLLDLDLYCLS